MKEPRPRFRLPWHQRLIPPALILLVAAGILELVATYAGGPLRQVGYGWVSRDGEILESEVRTETRDGDTVYAPFLRYRFEIRRPRPEPPVYDREPEYSIRSEIRQRPVEFEDRERAEAWIARYPVGAAVTVYHRRNHPRTALLDRDLTRGWTQVLLRAAVLALLIAALLWRWRRNSVAYLGGGERPVFEHAPRPIRAAEPGEVHPGKASYRRSAVGRIRPIPGYRQFPRGGP